MHTVGFRRSERDLRWLGSQLPVIVGQPRAARWNSRCVCCMAVPLIESISVTLQMDAAAAAEKRTARRRARAVADATAIWLQAELCRRSRRTTRATQPRQQREPTAHQPVSYTHLRAHETPEHLV